MGILGWVPIHGAGAAIPIVSKGTDIVSEVGIDNLFPLFPYVENAKSISVTSSTTAITESEILAMSKYRMNFNDGALAVALCDPIFYANGRYRYYLFYGIDSYPSAGTFRPMFDPSIIVKNESDSFPPPSEVLDDRYLFFMYNPAVDSYNVSLIACSSDGELPSDKWWGFLSKNGNSNISYNVLEYYDTRDEAIGKSGGSPYNPGGNSSPAGGGGNFGTDRESEDLTPLIPNGSSENDLVDAGIFTRYLVNNAQLKEFAKWLFVDNWGEAILRELTIATFGNIYDSLISVMSYPFAVGQLPGITTVAGNIYLGSLNSGAPSSGILAKSFSHIDWGSISITEYWGNFLDYAPHTKIQLFLPWGTGFVDIDPNEVMNGTLQVKTNIELSKGTCVHIVYTGEGAIIGTYNGFCGAQYPITAVDTSGKAIATAVSAVGLATAVGAGALAKSAGVAGLEAAQTHAAISSMPTGFGKLYAAQSGYAETAAQMFHKESGYSALSSKAAKTASVSSLAAARIPPSFVRNGSFAPNAAGMMPQKPFIVMTWPDQSVPEQYGSLVGYPSNIHISLGRLRGYTEVGAIHLEGINCTEHEREELMSLLQGGVIL